MILGVDHLALSTNDMEKSKQELIARGYELFFHEAGIKNDLNKKKLLRHYQERHALAFFNSADGVAIELTNHGKVHQGTATYYHDNDRIILNTPNFAGDKKFFLDVLKFRELSANRLIFSSFVPRLSCVLELVANKNMSLTTLDTEGANCLAFLTNNLDSVMNNAVKLGAWDVIKLAPLSVNSKQLNIGMYRIPGGAICEFIQVL